MADYQHLTPDTIMDAVETLGYYCTGEVQALNSYENRVFLVGLDQQPSAIVKFYRDGRWSDEQIIEEHTFCQQLADESLRVATAQLHNGSTLHQHKQFRFSLFNRLRARAAEFTDPDQLFELGESLAQLHQVGCQQAFSVRPSLSYTSHFSDPCETLLAFMPAKQCNRFSALFEQLAKALAPARAMYEQARQVRVHGDCHTGNILYDEGPLFVDFDDARMAPAIQDIWMLLSGTEVEQKAQLSEIVEGYEQIADFDRSELKLIEFLRTLRIVQQAGWRAARWQDPAFPAAFPWFNQEGYWDEFYRQLQQQAKLLAQQN